MYIWVHAHENNPDLPDIEDSGWKLSSEEIEYDWVKGSLVVPEQLVDILCNQNIVGDDDLEDDSAVDEGVEFTNMLDEVFENESDEEN